MGPMLLSRSWRCAAIAASRTSLGTFLGTEYQVLRQTALMTECVCLLGRVKNEQVEVLARELVPNHCPRVAGMLRLLPSVWLTGLGDRVTTDLKDKRQLGAHSHW